MTTLYDLCELLDETLQPQLFKDYAPNGLQVEGKSEIKKIVTGVTASEAMIDATIKEGADALLVHHGYFWRGENPAITGIKQRRIKKLLAANISLIAYHLPLDAHKMLGNNAQLAVLHQWKVTGSLGVNSVTTLGMTGLLKKELTLSKLGEQIEHTLKRRPQLIKGGTHDIKTIGWCTGAAQDYIEKAATAGLDAFLSGEISERTTHIARECGIHYIAAGHHATERYGVKALGKHVSGILNIRHQFIDIDNPV